MVYLYLFLDASLADCVSNCLSRALSLINLVPCPSHSQTNPYGLHLNPNRHELTSEAAPSEVRIMPDRRHSGSRCHSKSGRSRGHGQDSGGGHDDLGRGNRNPFEDRRRLGGRGVEKIGWGRNGAVRLDDPPTSRRGQDGSSNEIGSPAFIGRVGGPGRRDRFKEPEQVDPYARLGGIDMSRGLRMRRLGMGLRMGGLVPTGTCGRDPPWNLMTGRDLFDLPQHFKRQLYANEPMLGIREPAMRPEHGAEQFGSPLTGPRQNTMGENSRLRSSRSSMASRGRFDMRTMDRPRMPYGPMRHSPMQNRSANYQPPFVEDYEGSELDANMAQQAAMQQMMMNGGGRSPFPDESQHSDIFDGRTHLGHVDEGIRAHHGF